MHWRFFWRCTGDVLAIFVVCTHLRWRFFWRFAGDAQAIFSDALAMRWLRWRPLFATLHMHTCTQCHTHIYTCNHMPVMHAHIRIHACDKRIQMHVCLMQVWRAMLQQVCVGGCAGKSVRAGRSLFRLAGLHLHGPAFA